MISLKRLLQEQVDDTEFEISAELEEELKEAIEQEENPIEAAVQNWFYDNLLSSDIGSAAGALILGILAYKLRKPLKWVGKKLAVPIKLVGKQLAINAPFKAFLRLNDAGAAAWTRNTILKPLRRVKAQVVLPSNPVYKEAERLEGLIKNRTKPDDFLELAKSTRKMFKSETYKALRMIRNTEGRGYISDKLQTQFEKLFGELYDLKADFFDERYIRTTLQSLDISEVQIENMLSRIISDYQKPMKPMLPIDLDALHKMSDYKPGKQSTTLTQFTPIPKSQEPKLTFAQNTYKNTLDIASGKRADFQDIVDNLPAEIKKRDAYVDELMRFDKFPAIADYKNLNIPDKETWGRGDWLYNYALDELFYHANKFSAKR